MKKEIFVMGIILIFLFVSFASSITFPGAPSNPGDPVEECVDSSWQCNWGSCTNGRRTGNCVSNCNNVKTDVYIYI